MVSTPRVARLVGDGSSPLRNRFRKEPCLRETGNREVGRGLACQRRQVRGVLIASGDRLWVYRHN